MGDLTLNFTKSLCVSPPTSASAQFTVVRRGGRTVIGGGDGIVEGGGGGDPHLSANIRFTSSSSSIINNTPHSTPQKADSMIIDWPITSSLHPFHGSGYPLVMCRVQVGGGDLAARELGLGIQSFTTCLSNRSIITPAALYKPRHVVYVMVLNESLSHPVSDFTKKTSKGASYM